MDAAARRAARQHWRGHVFRSWSEADDYDALFWDSIPIDERARATWELSAELHRISHPNEPDEPRLSRSLRSLLAADVRFMVVGAYAVGVHGRPRATKDLDIWVEPSVENAPKVIRALLDFGAPLMGLTAKDLELPDAGLQIGREPLRIDVLTKISGLSFVEAWPSHIEASFADGVRCPVIGFDCLLANKRAAARPQDLADVAALEKLSALKSR